MSFWSDAGAEIWGAVSSPIQTISQAATNLWDSIKFNIGFQTGDPAAVQQVQEDIDSQTADMYDWMSTNPGATEQDYNNYVQNKFPSTFDQYVNQGNTGSANNFISTLGNSAQYVKIAFGIGILAIIVSLFRR